MSDLYNFDIPVSDFEIDVPSFIDQDISASTIAAIIEGGCSSGSYMPAVTYHEALETMNNYGDDVLSMVEEAGHGISLNGGLWAGLACQLVSSAVESWASSIEGDLQDIIDDAPTYGVGFGLVGCLFDSTEYYQDYDDAKQAVIDRLIDLADNQESEERAERWQELAESVNLESGEFCLIEYGQVIELFKLDQLQAIQVVLNGD